MYDWPWSGIHFTSGLIIGLILASRKTVSQPKWLWTIGVGLLAVWEVIERTLQYLDRNHHAFILPFKQAVAGFAFTPETNWNLLGDMTIGPLGILIGWLIIRNLRRRT